MARLGGILADYDAFKLGWTCPAMIVDYIRVYQPLPEVGPTMKKCNFGPETPDSAINEICSASLEGLKKFSLKQN